MPTIMTYTTPHDEMVSRFWDEGARCIRWSQKEMNRAKPDYHKLDVPPAMLEYLGRNRTNLVGYVPWTSPKTGDRWLGLVVEDTIDYRGGKAIASSTIPVYIWETVGSFGFIQWLEFRLAERPEESFTSIFCFTSHCMLRIQQRLLAGCTPIQTMLFVMAMLTYSACYTFQHGKVETLAILTPFGEFRTPYSNRTQADPIKTFIDKDRMDKYNRQRYDRMWSLACTNIFNKH